MATLNLASPSPTVHCVYRIVNFRNGKVYVGQTKYERDRYDQHFAALKQQKHHSQKLQADYHKYGDAAFYFEVIQYDISPDDIDDREAYWIGYYDSFHNGYNGTLGGKKPGGNFRTVVWDGIEHESIQAVSEISGLTVNEIRYGLRRKGYIPAAVQKQISRKTVLKLNDKPLPSRNELTEMAIRLGIMKVT